MSSVFFFSVTFVFSKLTTGKIGSPYSRFLCFRIFFGISHLASGILRILMEYIKTKNSLDSKLQNDSICSFGHLSFLEVKNGKMLNPELNIKNSLVPSCGCQISCLDPLASCRAMAATSCSANKLSTNRILLRLNVTLRLCEMEKGGYTCRPTFDYYRDC